MPFLHHHILSDGELHYCHILNGVYRQVHRLVVRIVADEFDVPFLLRAVDVFHRQILVSVEVERHDVHFSVNDVAEVVDPLEPYDISRFENGIHTVSVDKDGSVTRGYARNQYFAQRILAFVGKQVLKLAAAVMS